MKKKYTPLLSSLALGSIIAAALCNPASAKTTGYVVNIDGKDVRISDDNLSDAYLNYMKGNDSTLFKVFTDNAKNLKAFDDDKKGFVDASVVFNAYQKAMVNDSLKDYNINDITENAKSTDVLQNFVPTAQWENNEIKPYNPVEDGLIKKVGLIASEEGHNLTIQLDNSVTEDLTAMSVDIVRSVNGQEDLSFQWLGGSSSWDKEHHTLEINGISTNGVPANSKVSYRVVYKAATLTSNEITMSGDQQTDLKVEGCKALDITHIEVKFVDREPVIVELATPLENGQTSMSFTYGGKEFTAELESPWKEDANKLKIISAKAIDKNTIQVVFEGIEPVNISLPTPLENGQTSVSFMFNQDGNIYFANLLEPWTDDTTIENPTKTEIEKAIQDLPTADAVTIDDANKVKEVRDMINNLAVTNPEITINGLDKLDALETKLEDLLNANKDATAAQEVDKQILALPSPSELKLTDKDSVVAVQNAYDSLTEPQKGLVKNTNILTEATRVMATLNNKANKVLTENAIAEVGNIVRLNQNGSQIYINDSSNPNALSNAIAAINNYDGDKAQLKVSNKIMSWTATGLKDTGTKASADTILSINPTERVTLKEDILNSKGANFYFNTNLDGFGNSHIYRYDNGTFSRQYDKSGMDMSKISVEKSAGAFKEYIYTEFNGKLYCTIVENTNTAIGLNNKSYDKSGATDTTVTSLIETINSLPSVEKVTLDNKLDVDTAYSTFTGLIESQQAEVTNSDKLKLSKEKLDTITIAVNAVNASEKDALDATIKTHKATLGINLTAYNKLDNATKQVVIDALYTAKRTQPTGQYTTDVQIKVAFNNAMINLQQSKETQIQSVVEEVNKVSTKEEILTILWDDTKAELLGIKSVTTSITEPEKKTAICQDVQNAKLLLEGNKFTTANQLVTVFNNSVKATEGKYTAPTIKLINEDTKDALYSIGDNYDGIDDTIELKAGTVSQADATVKLHQWNDINNDNKVTDDEITNVITLSNKSIADGSVATSSLGDLRAGNYSFVLTVSDIYGNESEKSANNTIIFNLEKSTQTDAIVKDIDNLPPIETITTKDAKDITALNATYTALTEQEKTQVTNADKLATLKDKVDNLLEVKSKLNITTRAGAEEGTTMIMVQGLDTAQYGIEVENAVVKSLGGMLVAVVDKTVTVESAKEIIHVKTSETTSSSNYSVTVRQGAEEGTTMVMVQNVEPGKTVKVDGNVAEEINGIYTIVVDKVLSAEQANLLTEVI